MAVLSLRFATALLLLCSLSGCAAVRQQLGMTLITPATEIDLGRRLAQQIEAEHRVLPDHEVQKYVLEISRPLVEASYGDRPEIRYRIRVLDDPRQVNAFALPGGFLYVYSGLLLFAENEAEVAGVLAHEIGHVVGRHSANQMASRLGMQVVLAIALGEQPDALAEAAADLAGSGTMAAFSRGDERDADRYGVAYTIAAGYDPRGLVTFFSKLLAMEGGGSRSSFDTLMSTHPATTERIRDIEKRITRAGDPGGRTEVERFAQMRERLKRGYARGKSR